MHDLKMLFYYPWAPLFPLVVGSVLFYVTSRFSFLPKNIRNVILALCPIVMFFVGAIAGALHSGHTIDLFFGFLIGESFMALFAFYNLKVKSILSKIIGVFFLILYLWLIYVQVFINKFHI
jgi:hypothetical protein